MRWWWCPLPFKPITAAKSAKKNPASPVVPVSKTNPPIRMGMSVKNFNLYANSKGNINLLKCLRTLCRLAISLPRLVEVLLPETGSLILQLIFLRTKLNLYVTLNSITWWCKRMLKDFVCFIKKQFCTNRTTFNN